MCQTLCFVLRFQEASRSALGYAALPPSLSRSELSPGRQWGRVGLLCPGPPRRRCLVKTRRQTALPLNGSVRSPWVPSPGNAALPTCLCPTPSSGSLPHSWNRPGHPAAPPHQASRGGGNVQPQPLQGNSSQDFPSSLGSISCWLTGP